MRPAIELHAIDRSPPAHATHPPARRRARSPRVSAYRQPAPATPRTALPSRCELTFGDLPEASRTWLQEQAIRPGEPRRFDRPGPSSALPFLGVALLSALLTAALVAGLNLENVTDLHFDKLPPWGAAHLGMTVVSSVLAGTFLALRLTVRARSRRSPLRSFWYVHTAYLLDCDRDRIVAYPLGALTGHDAADSRILLSFGDTLVRVSFEEEAPAARFRRLVVAGATPAGVRAGRGELEAIEGADLLPEALLRRRGSAARYRDPAAVMATAIACGLVGDLVLPGVHARRAEARKFGVCRDFGARFGGQGCKAYLDAFPAGAYVDEADDRLFAAAMSPSALNEYRARLPQGRHVAEIAARAVARYDEVIAAYRARARPSADPMAADGIEALVRSLEAARDAGDTKAFVQLVDAGGHEADVPAPDAGEVLRALSDAVDEAASYGLLTCQLVAGAVRLPAAPPVVIEIRYAISRGPRMYVRETAASKPQSRELVYAWTFSFRWPRRPDLAPIAVSFQTRPGDRLTAAFPVVANAEEMMARSAVARLKPALLTVLGAPPPAAP